LTCRRRERWRKHSPPQKKIAHQREDGAIGAILADFGMNPAAFNRVFMIARTPGLVAHVVEERTREKPMRRVDPVNPGYDGPPAKGLSDKFS
jgi:citrate synthase